MLKFLGLNIFLDKYFVRFQVIDIKYNEKKKTH